jgi:hypothetical protein
MSSDLRKVQASFDKLCGSDRLPFPDSREPLTAPIDRGVYVIYGPRDKVLHVGATPRGQGGIRQRLSNHLHGQSSFTNKSEYLKQHGGPTLKNRYTYVRDHCTYRCLPIADDRLRALLEAYAIGHSARITLAFISLRLNPHSGRRWERLDRAGHQTALQAGCALGKITNVSTAAMHRR